VIVPYPEWFILGVSLFTSVLFIQAVQSVLWRSLLSSPYADPQLTALLFNMPTHEQPDRHTQSVAHDHS
jgi:hypothetical protein